VIRKVVGDLNDAQKMFVAIVIKSFAPKSIRNNINDREREKGTQNIIVSDHFIKCYHFFITLTPAV